MSDFELNLLPHQADFVTDTTTPHLGLVGGYGSGKTVALAYKALYLAALNPGAIGCILSPTFKMSQDVLIPCLMDCLDKQGINYEYAKSASKFEIFWDADSRSSIHTYSSENWERIRGISAAFGCFDEFDTVPRDIAWSAWRMMQSRLRAANAQVFQLSAVSTPEGYNFMHDYFMRDAKNEDGTVKTDRRLIKARTYDNPFLPPEYISNMLREYPSNLVASYVEGEFTNIISGNVYHAFTRKDNTTTKTLEDFPTQALQIGIDFNIGQCAAVISVSENGCVYVLDEITGVHNTEILVDRINARYKGRKTISFLYPDASGQFGHSSSNVTNHEILKRVERQDICSLTRTPNVSDRVGSVNTMICNGLGERKLFVNAEKCPKLLAGLEQQGYDKHGKPDKSGNIDHPLDALGYFVIYRYPIKGQSTVRVH